MEKKNIVYWDKIKTPQQLNKIVEMYVNETQNYKAKKQELEPLQNKLKIMKQELDKMEGLIKDKFLETYKQEQVLVNNVNDNTGEVRQKLETQDNKGTGYFTYTPAKKIYEIDKVKLLKEKQYEQFTKLEVVIDKDKLTAEIKKNGFLNLPAIEKIQLARVGIQKKNILNELKFKKKEIE